MGPPECCRLTLSANLPRSKTYGPCPVRNSKEIVGNQSLPEWLIVVHLGASNSAGCPRMQKAKLHVREFIAHSEQWQVIRHPSRKSQPSLLVGELLGRSTNVGLLFVAEGGERRFLPMTLDDFPSRTEFENLTRIELVELLERAEQAPQS